MSIETKINDLEESIQIIIDCCSDDIINKLKKQEIPFTLWRNLTIKENDLDEKNKNFLSLPKNLYIKIEKLCETNNYDPQRKIVSILESAVRDAEIINEDGFPRVINF